MSAVRQRVPASERREALIEAAVHEFALSGLHGTPVDRIARRVGVAQPYVFSLFPSKRDLFLAALERSFQRVSETFEDAARAYREGLLGESAQDPLEAMGKAYIELLERDRDYLMLQHQAYAACAADEQIRDRVRNRFARLVELVKELSGADTEGVDEFFRRGMSLNVAAALGVEDLSSCSPWVRSQLERAQDATGSAPPFGESGDARGSASSESSHARGSASSESSHARGSASSESSHARGSASSESSHARGASIDVDERPAIS